MKLTSFCFLMLAAVHAWAVRPDLKRLPIGLAPSETMRAPLEAERPTAAPVAPVHALGEWEQARAAMTLWSNPSLVRELTKRGKVILIADGESEKQWWADWLGKNGISAANVSYFVIATDSVWIRDYGPWPILDGKGAYGLVHNTYNRPRPTDNLVAGKIASQLGLPFYDTGLVHTGGNYYADGVGNAFSSTLVFTENSKFTKNDVVDRMREFQGIDRYTTSRLNPGITIEHLDTYGKLVSPDTFVFSDFPAGSRYRADSEAMVKLLQTLKSPYGTPYKIHRMKMSSGPGVEFRAYLNSFISNRALYYPTYGNDAVDAEAKRVYQAALPGYEIVGVDSGNTAWGDSVHCRNRNLIEWQAVYLFPKVEHLASGAGDATEIDVEAFPSPGHSFRATPELVWSAAGGTAQRMPLTALGGFRYQAKLPSLAAGAKVTFHVEARDDGGREKRAPEHAEIEVAVGAVR